MKKSFRSGVSALALIASLAVAMPSNEASAVVGVGVHTDASAKLMHAATVASITSSVAAMQAAIAAAIVAFQVEVGILITEQTRIIDMGNEKLIKALESLANGDLRAGNEAANLAMRRDVAAEHQASLDACVHVTSSLKDEALKEASTATQKETISAMDNVENGRKYAHLTPEQVDTTFQDIILKNRTGRDGTPTDSAVHASTIMGTNQQLDGLSPDIERKARDNALTLIAGRPEPQINNPESTLSAAALSDRATATLRRSTSTEALAYVDSLTSTPANGADGTQWPSRWGEIKKTVESDYSPESLAGLEKASGKELLEGLNRKLATANKLAVLDAELRMRQVALLASLNYSAVDNRNAQGIVGEE